MNRTLVRLASACAPATALVACGGWGTNVQTSTVTSAEIATPQTPKAAITAEALPTGATLTVRTVHPISSERERAGTPFEAVLSDPILTTNGEEVLPAGAKVYGNIVESREGGQTDKPRLTLTLTQLQGRQGPVTLVTDASGAEGDRDGAVKNIGTLIGSAAPGSAGPGAAVGGAAALHDDGRAIMIKPGTLIEFHLTQPARLK